MRRLRWVPLALLLLLAAVPAFADGAFVPRVAVGKPVRTPDQRALLRWDEATSTETLVIETTLQGEGTEFGWIVPLPAAPKVEASTTGLFPTLDVLTAPAVRLFPDGAWIVLAALGVGLWAAVRWWRRPLHWAVAPLLPPLSLVFGVAGLFVISPPGCAATGPPAAVDVLARETVGVFDTATLRAADAKALHAWLDDNGFGPAPPGMDAVAESYVREGWVFVASKVRAEAASGDVRRIHPLAFTFPAKEAVYPMRLTGVVAESLALDLYVFGDRRAEADGLTVEHCAGRRLGRRDVDWDTHPELSRQSRGAAAVTKLTGTLDAAAMSHDVHLRWTGFAEEVRTLWSAPAAWAQGLAYGAWVFGGLLVAAAVRSRWALPADARMLVPWDLGAFAVAIVCGLVPAAVVAARLPGVPEEARVTSPWDASAGADAWAHPPDDVRGDAAKARAWAASVAAGRENAVTGGPVREEDSPGNWTLEAHGGKVVLVTYDAGLRRTEVDLSPR